MTMRWLTREWLDGALPAEEHAARWRSYLDHRDSTAIHLPPALHRLAATGVEGAITLHRAVPEWWAIEAGKALTLCVMTDDPSHGDRQRIVLQYLGRLEIDGADAGAIDDWLRRPDARLLYDEIEVLPGRRFEHRFLLAPGGELTLRFDNVALISAPTSAEDHDALHGRRAGQRPTPRYATPPTG